MAEITMEQLRSVPFSQRWGILKPVLQDLYLHQDKKLTEVVQSMRAEYGFMANEPDYKYQFRKWKWKKNVPAVKKTAILEMGEHRIALGKSSIPRYKGKQVGYSKLLRHKKCVARRKYAFLEGINGQPLTKGLFSNIIPFDKRVFLHWNVPIGATAVMNPDRNVKGFLFLGAPSSPSEISMSSPISTQAAMIEEQSTIFSGALWQKSMIERVQFFMQGSHDKLVQSMNKSEARVMSIWLYQFWFFAFKTAKDWGYFPLDLSADDLGFQKNQELGYSVALSANSTPDGIKSPSNICHWSEHILDYDEYVGDFEAPPEETPYEQLLRDSLETSNFSSYVTSQLPLEICHLARTIERSPNELLEESLGFAIMACNYDLTAATLEKVEEREIDISGVYPYHLAVTYLDGSNECCRILDHIAWSLSSTKFSMQKCFVNDMGHTVLDSLMATILRSHTSVPPLVLDSAWRGESRFSGEAIDICGRWQADSTCYRSLLSAGRTLVPLSWKHKFCHTSAQAISHCLLVIGNNTGSWGLSRPSGLFVKYCMHCGKRLTLSPLHTLIMVAFHLAQSALEGEDLFGVIACLLQILSRLNVSESPSPEAEASVNRLLDLEAPFCDHMPMSPLQLAEKLRSSQDNGWSEKVNIGWKIMCHILQQAQDEFEIRPWEKGLQAYYKLADEDKLVGFDITPVDVESNKAEGYEYHDWCPDAEGLFGNNKYLGHVRAAVQTELLTYRRSRDTDPWLSSYIDVDALLRCLDSRSPISIPLIDSGLMSPHCSCGQFLGDCGWPTKFHVMREGATFSNMDLPSSRGLVIPYPPSTESFLTRGVLEVTPEYRESDIDLEGDAENDKDSNFRA